MEALPRFLMLELAEAFRRTPSPCLDQDFPKVLPCFRLDRSPTADASNCTSGAGSGGGSTAPRLHWRRGHWHTVLHGEKRQSSRMQWFQPVYVGLG